MPSTLPQPAQTASGRTPVAKRVLMCRPDHFDVVYKINPWMDPAVPTDTSLAVRQWQTLYDTYVGLGIQVDLIDGIPGLPDMVYAANAFQHPERQPEGPAYMDWFREAGFDVRVPVEVNEGEGDILLVGDTILAGTGFRSDSTSHAEIARIFDREVVTLRLVDPSFYHLDTAIAVLDDENIAYLPSAFDAASLEEIERRYPDAVEVSAEDASILGLNSYSDGLHVVIAEKAVGFEASLRERGYEPVGVDLSELLLGGGGVKCCTLELRK
jgi:N-dimethylarginine dimethylaminohydrolase